MTVSQKRVGIPVQFRQTAGRRRDRSHVRQRHPLERQAKLVCHLRTRLVETPLGGKPSHRLRNHQRDRNADRYRHRAQHRDAAPAQQRQQCRRGRGGQQRAGGCEHNIKAGHSSAVARRRGLDDECETWRHRRGQAEADDEAQHGKHAPRALRNQTNRPSANAADECAQYQLALAPPGVGQAAPRDRAADRADTAAVQNDSGLPVGQVPLRSEHREQECHDGEVEKLQHRDERQQAEVDPVAWPQPCAVEQRQQRFGCLSVHGRLLLAPCLVRRVRPGRRCCEVVAASSDRHTTITPSRDARTR